MTSKIAVEATYAVMSEDRALVKVGKSTDVTRRFRQLGATSPVGLVFHDLLAPREAWVHQRIAHTRSHGEWFVADQAIPLIRPWSLTRYAARCSNCSSLREPEDVYLVAHVRDLPVTEWDCPTCAFVCMAVWDPGGDHLFQVVGTSPGQRPRLAFLSEPAVAPRGRTQGGAA